MLSRIFKLLLAFRRFYSALVDPRELTADVVQAATSELVDKLEGRFDIDDWFAQ